MGNTYVDPYQIIFEKLDAINTRLKTIEDKSKPALPSRIPFRQFCRDQGITPPTGYSWIERGIIRTEMIGGRRFVLSDSILVHAKYQREPQPAE